MINYANNTDQFVKWFDKNFAHVENLVTENKLNEALVLISEPLQEVLPNISFQIHYNKKDNNYILEFNTLLDSSKKIFVSYLCDKLTKLNLHKWSFYYYHPALMGTFNYGEMLIRSDNIVIIPIIDKAKRSIDIKILKNDFFDVIEDQDAYMVMYMLLIDTLGEITTEAYIGTIEYLTTYSKIKYFKKKRIQLNELRAYIDMYCISNNWQVPENIHFVIDQYKLKSKGYEIRKDLIEGTTYCIDLLNEENYPDTKPQVEYLRRCYIGYYSIVISHPVSIEKKEITKIRENIEKEVQKIIQGNKHGMIVHAAFGRAHSYIDYFVYDQTTQDRIKNFTERNKQLEIIEL